MMVEQEHDDEGPGEGPPEQDWDDGIEEDEGELVEASATLPLPPRPLLAVVGRPNVGKSTLFNRLVGARLAIVEDKPGVTRDRLYGEANWDGCEFLVVDTGGVDPSLETGLPAHIRAQANAAVDEADAVLLVVDGRDGLCAIDMEIAELLRRSGKAILVGVNKCESEKTAPAALEVHSLGLGDVFPVSALHGSGFGDLCDAIVEVMRAATPSDLDVMPKGTRIAFIGRPNVGKSTLVNTLLRQPRVIVDDVPGTTRDPIHLPFRYRGRDVVLIDTAGVRRRRQVARAMEKLAAIKSIRSMERTQVVALVIDAERGVADQDQRLARMAFERGKGVVVVLHKWDKVVGDARLARERLAEVREALAFLENPFIVRTSVTGTGRDVGDGKARNLEDIVDACLTTAKALARRITTSALNEELQLAIADHSPPMQNARPVRLYFATQADSDPPFIVISANRGRCLAPAYERYLMRRIRKRWSLRGIPVRLVVRGRGKGAENKHPKAPRSRSTKG